MRRPAATSKAACEGDCLRERSHPAIAGTLCAAAVQLTAGCAGDLRHAGVTTSGLPDDSGATRGDHSADPSQRRRVFGWPVLLLAANSSSLLEYLSAYGVHLSSLLSFCHHGRVLLVALSSRPALSGAANRLGLVADLTSIRLLHTLARSRLGRRAVFYLWTAQSRPIPVQSLGQLLRFYVFFFLPLWLRLS